MPTDSFDCVIVGARCAGAPLAAHLARAGMKVCVVDAAKLPSGQALSTHAITPTGMDLLDELGVGDRIRAIAPAVAVSRYEIGGAHLDMRYAPGRALYCPRRSRLDPVLQEAAVAAGADLRDETTVVDLLRDGDRAAGVRVRHRGGSHDIRARYWRERDVESVPLFAQAAAMGSLGYANPFNELVFAHVGATRALDARVTAVIERRMSPFAMIPVWRVLAWTGAALMRGRFEVWPHFVASGKLGLWVDGEVGRRRKLLAEARRRLAEGPTTARG